MLRLVVVEDDPAHQALLRAILERTADLRVIGWYPTAEAALAAASWQEVDLLLADLRLPGISGMALIARVLTQYPTVLPLAYTLHEDAETVVAALNSGARGYLLKSESPDGIVRAIRDAVEGHCPISLPVTRHLFAAFQRQRAANAVEPLSVREATLFRWVASGSSYKEISTHLGISENTVHTHVRNIHRKLHAANRREALQQARNLGYLQPLEAGTAARP